MKLPLKIAGWSLLVLVLLAAGAGAREPQAPEGKDLSWAFPVVDKNPPAASPDDGQPKSVPGSSKSYTKAQIDNLSNPPDWFPDEHPPMPPVVARGSGPAVPACASCHLASGQGHPESADLAGLSADYLIQQMADFKSGARNDPARMSAIGKATSDDDAMAAAMWFASLTPKPWVRVVEAEMVPKTYVAPGRMRLPLPDGGMEPIGKRIITVPEDPKLAAMRDPHSGFIAYVPPGSLAKGKDLVENGGTGQTTPCDMCHGDSLDGAGQNPRVAGLNPIYIARQLYNFQTGASAGQGSDMMTSVVRGLSDDDIIAISAYVGSLKP